MQEILTKIRCNCSITCPNGLIKGKCVIYTGPLITTPIRIVPNTNLDIILQNIITYIRDNNTDQDITELWEVINEIQTTFSDYYTKTEIDNLLSNFSFDLSLGIGTSTTQDINNSGGTGVTLISATPSLAGLLSATDKTKLDSIVAGASVSTFNSGNLSPLFTTLVSNPSTTPSLSFSLTNAPVNTWFGNNTNSITTPVYNNTAALTSVDDTNVTITLSGSPNISLLNPVSIEIGWNGVLSNVRGGTGLSSIGTANQLLRVNSGGTELEYFSPVWGIGTVTSFSVTDLVVGLDFLVTAPTTTPNLEISLTSGYTIPTITQLADYVDKTTNQTIGGNKTFSNAINVNGSMYIGRGAGNISTNVAIGFQSLYSNTTGYGNVAIGPSSLYSNTVGIYNISVGHQSLYNNTIGGGNLAIGQQSLWSNTTAWGNLAIGHQSLYNNTIGGGNLAIGYQSLYINTTGANNVAIGGSSLYSNTTGVNNLAVGAQSLYYNTTGANNIAIGSSSQKNTTTGANNVAVGVSSMQNNTVGTNTIAIGTNTLQYNTTGNYNVALGSTALQNNTTGSYNIAIGYNAGSPNTDSTISNKLYIGNKTSTNAAISQHIIVGDLSTKILTFNGYNSTGNRTLGVTSDGTLRLAGEAGQYTGTGGSSTATFTFNHNMGTIPTHVTISPMNSATVGAGLWYWSATSTTVTITFATAITASDCEFSYNVLE